MASSNLSTADIKRANIKLWLFQQILLIQPTLWLYQQILAVTKMFIG